MSLDYDFLPCFDRTLADFARQRGLGKLSEYADCKMSVPTFRDLVSALEHAPAAQGAAHHETLRKLRALADGAGEGSFIFGVGE